MKPASIVKSVRDQVTKTMKSHYPRYAKFYKGFLLPTARPWKPVIVEVPVDCGCFPPRTMDDLNTTYWVNYHGKRSAIVNTDLGRVAVECDAGGVPAYCFVIYYENYGPMDETNPHGPMQQGNLNNILVMKMERTSGLPVHVGKDDASACLETLERVLEVQNWPGLPRDYG
ncbi:hypothetical protein DXG01_002424 [Tephrocybe rancida]|nr:hypothetical protein DXG01_002424 [Tephrocybe rancida]